MVRKSAILQSRMFGIPSLSGLSLQRRLALVVAISLLGIFASFAYLGNQALSGSTQQTLQQRLFLAQMASSHFDALLNHGLEELQFAAKGDQVDLEDGNLEPEKSILREIFPQLIIFSYNVFLLDKDGKVLWTEPYDARLVGTNLSHQPDIAKALAAQKPLISDLSYIFYTFASDKPVVLSTVPVRSKDGRITGLLGGATDLTGSAFDSYIAPIGIGKTGHVELIDEHGMVLAGTMKDDNFKRWHHADVIGDLFYMNAAAGPVKFPFTHQTSQGDSEVVAFAPLSSAHWGVSIEQDADEAFGPTRLLQARLAMLAGVTLSIAILLVTVSVRSVIGPVRGLTKASKAIASGDLTTPVNLSGPAEIGVLAQSFDVMRKELHQSRAEIEKWNKELEDRVRQRTSELSAMFEVSQIVASTFNLEALLSTVVRRIVSILQPADAGAIFLADPSIGGLVARAVFAKGDLLTASRLHVGEVVPVDFADLGTAGCHSVLELAATIRKTNLDGEQPQEDPRFKPSEGQNAIYVPLVAKGQVIGCLLLLAVESKTAFTDLDLRVGQALADQVAIAIENAHLAEEASMVEALKKADRLKTEFISTVSHELRTPLASIKGYTSTLLRDDTDWDSETQREFLQIIDEESDKLRELIDNLLEMSKMEAGFLTIERQPVLIPKVAAKAVAELTPRAKRHTFVLDFPSRFPVVEADPRRVEQILHNLLENAIKYSPDGGNIIVRGRANGDAVDLAVSDEGVGMSPAETEKVFERFYRGENALTKRTAGSGLGLSIAKGLVEAQGGRIWVESAPDEGSTFHFVLPRTQLDVTGHDEGA